MLFWKPITFGIHVNFQLSSAFSRFSAYSESSPVSKPILGPKSPALCATDPFCSCIGRCLFPGRRTLKSSWSQRCGNEAASWVWDLMMMMMMMVMMVKIMVMMVITNVTMMIIITTTTTTMMIMVADGVGSNAIILDGDNNCIARTCMFTPSICVFTNHFPNSIRLTILPLQIGAHDVDLHVKWSGLSQPMVNWWLKWLLGDKL